MRCSPKLLLFFAANAHCGLFGLTQFRWGYIAALPQFHSRNQAQEPNLGKFAFLTYMDHILPTRMTTQVITHQGYKNTEAFRQPMHTK